MSLEFDTRAYSRMPEHDVLADIPGGRMGYRIADWFAAAVAIGVSGAVLVNIFMLQTGGVRLATKGATSVSVEPKARAASAQQANPSMVFAPPAVGGAPAQAPSAPTSTSQKVVAPAASAPTPQQGALLPPAALPTPRVPSPMIADIQRELARRGLYDGTADGLTGPKTEAAIRAFEQAAHLRATAGEPTETVLAQLRRAPAAQVAVVPASPAVAPATAAARAIMGAPTSDAGVTGSVRPPGDLPGSSPRILAVQKSLALLGYGPIKLDGQPGTETRLAIQRFERDRNLPATGEISDRMVRELAAVSGAPID